MMGKSLRFAAAVSALVGMMIVLGESWASAQEADDHGAGTAAEQDHHGTAAADGGPNPLAVDPDLAIWTAVIFLLLLAVLGKFAWPQIAAALDARERGIEENIAAAKATNEEAKRLFGEHEARLAAAAGEVRALLEEARRDAEATRSRILSEAQNERQQELQRALREIKQAKDGAIQELAVTSANVAIELARKVVREKLTADEQSMLVRSALDKLAATAPSEN
jgi:F-type H+-transporting ATPase subunit b